MCPYLEVPLYEFFHIDEWILQYYLTLVAVRSALHDVLEVNIIMHNIQHAQDDACSSSSVELTYPIEEQNYNCYSGRE